MFLSDFSCLAAQRINFKITRTVAYCYTSSLCHLMWKCLPQLSSSAYLGFLVWDKWLFALIVARWCTNITFTNVISWFMIHTCPREDLRHPWSPIWDSRSFALVLGRRLWGMIHVSPLKTIPSTTDNSSRMLKNGWMTVGVPSFESVNQDYGLEFLQLVIWNWKELRCINMLYFDSSVCVSSRLVTDFIVVLLYS